MKERLNVAERGNMDDPGKRRLQAVTPGEGADRGDAVYASTKGASASSATNATNTTKSERLTLVIDELPHAAYMVNHKFEVTWFNEQARLEIPGMLGEMPPHTDDRSIFRLLLDDGRGEISDNTRSMLGLNLALAKARMNLSAILQPLRGISGSRAQLL